jgi:hypothetical protein
LKLLPQIGQGTWFGCVPFVGTSWDEGLPNVCSLWFLLLINYSPFLMLDVAYQRFCARLRKQKIITAARSSFCTLKISKTFSDQEFPSFSRLLSLKSIRKILCLHLPSLQPYNNKLGLPKLTLKNSQVDLQSWQQSDVTWSFRMYPLKSKTLQDFSLKGLNT